MTLERVARSSAAVGGALWVGLWALELELPARYLLLATLVLLPLLATTARLRGSSRRALGLALYLQPVAAAALAASFLLPPGAVAAALAAPWAGVAALLAVAGLLHLRASGLRLPEVLIAAGLAGPTVGAAWTLAHRLDLAPFGFGGTWALLTAMHFHHAGATAPLLVGLAGRRLERGWALGAWRVAAAGALVGPWVLAAGITLSPALELIGGVLEAGALVLFALVTLLAVVPRLRSRPAQAALATGALALLPAMLLAAGYAARHVLGTAPLNLAEMATWHGTANALGFGLLGALAWTLEPARGPHLPRDGSEPGA